MIKTPRASNDNEDYLDVVRGFFNGTLISLLLWALIIWLVLG